MKVQIDIIDGPDKGKSWSFSGAGSYLVGRGPDCRVRLDDMAVSRRHFALEMDWNDVKLRDLGSTNGIMLNDRRCGGKAAGAGATGDKFCGETVPLKDGDEVRAGDTLLKISITGIRQGRSGRFTRGTVERPKLTAGQLARISGYTVEAEIATGGFATVYSARRRSDSGLVAVKVISPKIMALGRSRQAALREIECLKKLHHPNLVALLDSGAVESTIYCVLEYCPGRTLESYAASLGGKLEPGTAAPLLVQALRALAYIHVMGYVHRDIKPANLLLSEFARETQVKISDFGLAKKYELAGLSGMTGPGAIAGTAHFMPPELVADFRHVKPAADVWSMGATFYNLLTGAFPRDHDPAADPIGTVLNAPILPVRSRGQGLPGPLADVVDTALAARPENRYRDGGEMLKALRKALGE